MRAPPFSNESVRILNLEQADAERMRYGFGRGVNLGSTFQPQATQHENLVNTAILAGRDQGTTVFAEWQGGNVPRGLRLDGQATITGMQNGFFVLSDGRSGTYERLVEAGGDSRREHKVLFVIS